MLSTSKQGRVNEWPILIKSSGWSSSKLVWARYTCQMMIMSDWPRQSQTWTCFIWAWIEPDVIGDTNSLVLSMFILTCHHVNIFLDLFRYCHSLHSIFCPGIHCITYWNFWWQSFIFTVNAISHCHSLLLCVDQRWQLHVNITKPLKNMHDLWLCRYCRCRLNLVWKTNDVLMIW